jgi:hypothetical protein
MNKVLVTTLGVILVTGAVSTWAGKEERLQLEQCEADIVEHYGKGTRTRLRSVSRGDDGISMRILVRSAQGGNEAVVCTADINGLNTLMSSDGVSLAPTVVAGEEQVTLAE